MVEEHYMSVLPSKTMIDARGLSKYYGSFVAIEDISFAIPEGQIVAFMGPNGAGKSTTMRILTGYSAPSKGTVSIAGIDIHKDRLSAARRLGYLPENGPLYDDMTPQELLSFFAAARGLDENTAKARIHTVVEQCSLLEVLDKPTGKLSKGFRQRVGLAQALLHDPDVLIMDEPTSGLDPNQIRDFRKNISELGKTKTILLSTHILQEVDAVAERVIFVHAGHLVFDGKVDDLRRKGSLEESFYELTDHGRSVAAKAEAEAAEAHADYAPGSDEADDDSREGAAS